MLRAPLDSPKVHRDDTLRIERYFKAKTNPIGILFSYQMLRQNCLRFMLDWVIFYGNLTFSPLLPNVTQIGGKSQLQCQLLQPARLQSQTYNCYFLLELGTTHLFRICQWNQCSWTLNIVLPQHIVEHPSQKKKDMFTHLAAMNTCLV